MVYQQTSSWKPSERNQEKETLLAEPLSLHPVIAHLLIRRGLASPEAARRFLYPQWDHLPDITLLPDVEKGLARLLQAWERQENILFYGDYDVDGITGTAQWVSFFREIGLPVDFFLPHRLNDGYGLNRKSLETLLAKKKPDLLVTIDNGTNAYEELCYLAEQKIDVIVIDHHEAPKKLPPVTALLNPKRSDSQFPDPVASAGLVFLLLIAFRKKLRERGVSPLPNLKRYLDLACLGTIADIVPLTNTNRLLVKEGLKEIERSERPGIRALLAQSQSRPPIGVGTVSFRLAPRINAAGRLSDPQIALKLLLSENEEAATCLASELDSLNRRRQQIEEEVLQEAVIIIEREQKQNPGIVVASEKWHLGVVGIVAAKLVERYGRPAIVLSLQDGIGKGSGRTVPGISLYKTLNDLRDCFIGFGGHDAACGLTLDREKVSEFRSRFNERLRGEPLASNKIRILDALVPFCEISPLFVKQLQLLEPFGPSNPSPLLGSCSVRFHDCRIVGQKHLKAKVIQEGTALEAIAFDQGDFLPKISSGNPVTIIHTPQIQCWNGIETLQLNIKEISLTN
ncbi:MAG: single-stranded-DNA-specific exonuclease RecJ [Deltaproteobacteria bacterium]|nr:single-stranded-DNA-specific exonuclease RecJ [Deltaproteobacteria bacterium]MBI2501359.1 single-stranded-DNA-specific exonuclease RecJ [Deltaproteobacteria bacterium]